MGTVFQATAVGDVRLPGRPSCPGGHRSKHQQERWPDGLWTRHTGQWTARLIYGAR